jgi:hypothetical protein
VSDQARRGYRRALAVLVAVPVLSFSGCGVEGPWSSAPQASCLGGEVPFSPAVLAAAPLSGDDHPAMTAVLKELRPRGHLWISGIREGVDVRLLSETDGEASFAFGETADPTKDFPYANFRRKNFRRNGHRWMLRNYASNCHLIGWARGRKASPWSLAQPVGPSSTHVSVLVQELGCASGRAATGLVEDPTILWTDAEAIVTLTIRPRSGNQTCQGNPPTRFEFDLPGPLGARTLMDGSHVPPAPPGTGAPADSGANI